MAYRRRNYFYECPFCGAALDPGETCDCRKSMEQPATPEQAEEQPATPEQAEEQPAQGKRMRLVYETGGQMRMETA